MKWRITTNKVEAIFAILLIIAILAFFELWLRVIDVSFSLIEGNTKIEVMEYCDLYFSVAFNKDDFGKLIEELKELHTSMK